MVAKPLVHKPSDFFPLVWQILFVDGSSYQNEVAILGVGSGETSFCRHPAFSHTAP